MSIVTSEAILMRKTELRETSLILNFYTRESGKIVGIIKGVRSPQPQFGALFEIFSLDKIVFYERKKSDIFTVSQCELIDYFPGIRRDLEKMSIASYFMEMIDTISAQGEKNEEMFNVIVESLRSLEKSSNPKKSARIFELKILKLAGMMPSLEECMVCGNGNLGMNVKFSIKSGSIVCPNCFPKEYTANISRGAVDFMRSVMSSDSPIAMEVPGNVEEEIDNVIKNFINFHIQKRFKSVEFMGQISGK